MRLKSVGVKVKSVTGRSAASDQAAEFQLKNTVSWVNQRQKLIPCLFVTKSSQHG